MHDTFLSCVDKLVRRNSAIQFLISPSLPPYWNFRFDDLPKRFSLLGGS
jgi:hypothetical protein